MATTILIKSNSTSGVAPRVDELSYAELALNTADGHLYTRTTSDEIVNLTSWDQLYNKPSAFTPSSHTHNITDITNLQSTLDTKQPIGDYILDTDSRLSDARTPLSHSHDVSDIESLSSILSNKSDTNHNHTIGDNTFVGLNSLLNISGGINNSSFGTGSMYTNTDGSNNVAMGTYALFSSLVDENCAVGSAALASNTTGVKNAAFGAASLSSTTTGINNVAFGTYSGTNITTGSNNIMIGFGSNSDAPSLDNCIVLGSNATAFVSGDFVVGSITNPINISTTVGTSGSANSLPSQPLGYINIRLNGILVKIPYYRE